MVDPKKVIFHPKKVMVDPKKVIFHPKKVIFSIKKASNIKAYKAPKSIKSN
jgi:hypothetical protein